MTNQQDNQIYKNIFYLLLGISLVCGLFWVYVNPQKFMTDTGKTLVGKELFDAENAVRGNTLSVGSTILILGTLWANFSKLDIERTKIKQEKEKEWRTQVESFYGEWSGIFLSQTKIGIELAKMKSVGNTDEINRLQKIFEDYNLQRRKMQFKILMLEKRENVINIFKEINQYALPHEPIIKIEERIEEILKKNPEQDPKLRTFWDELADKDNGTTVGLFHGIIEKRLTKFCEWISNPDDPFEMPNFEDYIEYVKEKKPAIAAFISTSNN